MFDVLGSKLPLVPCSRGRDGHQPSGIGVYIPFTIPYWGLDDHPQYKELIDPGWYPGNWFGYAQPQLPKIQGVLFRFEIGSEFIRTYRSKAEDWRHRHLRLPICRVHIPSSKPFPTCAMLIFQKIDLANWLDDSFGYVLMASIGEEWPETWRHFVTLNGGVTQGNSPEKSVNIQLSFTQMGSCITMSSISSGAGGKERLWTGLNPSKDCNDRGDFCPPLPARKPPPASSSPIFFFWLADKSSMKDDNYIGKFLLVVFVWYTDTQIQLWNHKSLIPRLATRYLSYCISLFLPFQHDVLLVFFFSVFFLPCFLTNFFEKKLPTVSIQGVAASLWVGMCLFHFCREGTGCCRCQGSQRTVTLPETNSEFTPRNGWLEYDPFLLGFRGFGC